MKRFLIVAATISVFSIMAFADLARPDKSPSRVPKPKGVAGSMTIRLNANATEATLRIPKSQIKQLRAELEQLDGDDSTAAVTEAGTFSRMQTIVSGAFLSLALVFGGLWFVRSGKSASTGAKTLIILVAVVGIISAASIVYANVGPPPQARSITSALFDKKVFTPYQFASGKIRIETTDSNSVELEVPMEPSPSPSGE